MRGRDLASVVAGAALALGVSVVAARPSGQRLTGAPATPAHQHHRGAAAHVVGDFDGDGVPDLAVGAPGQDAVVLRLSASRQVAYLHPYLTGSGHSRFGAALAIGDFNGDGYSDLAVGAPRYHDAHAPARGAVFEFDGSRSGLHSATLRVVGPDDGTHRFDLGTTLAAADVDGDGRTDLAAGMSRDAETWILHGTAHGLDGSSPQVLTDAAPSALAFADVNGDHRPDLLIGAANYPAEDGSVCTYPDGPRGRFGAVASCLHGRAVGVGNGLGATLATGDVDGDGRPDVVAGAPGDTDSEGRRTGSAVLLFAGPRGLGDRFQRLTVTDLGDGAGFGTSVAVGGERADGSADLIVGAPGAVVDGYAGAGAIYVLRAGASGPDLGHVRRVTQSTPGVPGDPADGAGFGQVLATGRFSRAGGVDVVVGAPHASTAAYEGGLVIRLPGGPDGLRTKRAWLLESSTVHGRLGRAIA